MTMTIVWFVLLFLFVLLYQASHEPVSSFSITPSTNLIPLGPAVVRTAAARAPRRPPTSSSTTTHMEAQQAAPNSRLSITTGSTTRQHLARQDDDGDENGDDSNSQQYKQDDDALTGIKSTIFSCPRRSFLFSLAMIAAGAALGPFLDSYHSAFDVLEYNEPISFTLWGSSAEQPALTTAFWVPALFGLAGFIIGWLYILLDATVYATTASSAPSELIANTRHPSPPKILIGISLFTFQYWLSGALYQSGMVDRTTILNIMSLVAASGFYFLDKSMAGFVASAATALGGPLIEAGLITASRIGIFAAGYHYNDLGETGFFPLWIVPVYFLGGPAVGNLARGIWNGLSTTLVVVPCDGDDETSNNMDAVAATILVPKQCTICNDSQLQWSRSISCHGQYHDEMCLLSRPGLCHLSIMLCQLQRGSRGYRSYS